MAGAFLQTATAEVLRKLAISSQNMLDEDRQEVVSFLSSSHGSEYAPSAGQITGILKQMGDEMGAGLKQATDAENDAIRIYNELMSAKTKEVNSLSKRIEDKLKLIGELGVALAGMKNDLTDTEEALLADQDFLAGLDKSCAARRPSGTSGSRLARTSSPPSPRRSAS